MGLYQFKLPDIGEGIAEAEIVAWHVKVGDKVEEDQQLADMMTDKATVEMDACRGVVKKPARSATRSQSVRCWSRLKLRAALLPPRKSGGGRAAAG